MDEVKVYLKDSSQPKTYLGVQNIYKKQEFTAIKTSDGSYVWIPTSHIFCIFENKVVDYCLKPNEEVEVWLNDSSGPVLKGECHSTFVEAGFLNIMSTKHDGTKNLLEFARFPVQDIYQVKKTNIK